MVNCPVAKGCEELVKRVCPECGADREGLQDSLREPPVKVDNPFGPIFDRSEETENHAIACHIISGCDSCQEFFRQRGKYHRERSNSLI